MGIAFTPGNKPSATRSPSRFKRVFGRVTFDMFEGYWPHALDDPQLSDDERAVARHINALDKIVFSKGLKPSVWKNTRVLPDIDPDEIEKLKSGPGRDIGIYGSGTIVRRLTQLGLVDEYVEAVVPTFLGRGRSMVEGVQPRVPLRLIGHTGSHPASWSSGTRGPGPSR